MGRHGDQVTGVVPSGWWAMYQISLHHDLHEGKRTVKLRDGRYLSEQGFVDAPSLFDLPPF